METASSLTQCDPEEQGAPPKSGRGRIWVAVLCIGLSNILNVLWIWSLLGASSPR